MSTKFDQMVWLENIALHHDSTTFDCLPCLCKGLLLALDLPAYCDGHIFVCNVISNSMRSFLVFHRLCRLLS